AHEDIDLGLVLGTPCRLDEASTLAIARVGPLGSERSAAPEAGSRSDLNALRETPLPGCAFLGAAHRVCAGRGELDATGFAVPREHVRVAALDGAPVVLLAPSAPETARSAGLVWIRVRAVLGAVAPGVRYRTLAGVAAGHASLRVSLAFGDASSAIRAQARSIAHVVLVQSGRPRPGSVGSTRPGSLFGCHFSIAGHTDSSPASGSVCRQATSP